MKFGGSGGQVEERKEEEKGRKKDINLMPTALKNYTVCFKKKSFNTNIKVMHIYVRKHTKKPVFLCIHMYVYKCTKVI